MNDLPNVDHHDIAPFWDGLRRHEFLLFRCKTCGAWYWPVEPCRNCASQPSYDNMEWAPASGRGRVCLYHVHWHSSQRQRSSDDTTPYVVALIELEEGPIFGSNVVGCAAEDVRVGMSVRVRFHDVEPPSGDPFTLAVFEPDPE